MKSRRSLRLRIYLGLGTTILLIGGAAIWAWTSDRVPKRPPMVAANDLSRRATACLAADSATAANTDTAAKVWAAMQSAGGSGGKNVQRLIEPAVTPEQAGTYLAGLVNQHCDLIVTVGTPFGQAIPALAKEAPGVQFTAVDAALSNAPAGTCILAGADAPDRIRTQVQALQSSRLDPGPTHQ